LYEELLSIKSHIGIVIKIVVITEAA